MKGIVFTEFLEMVEESFGYETVDKIIVNSDLSSQGAYTAVGTYPHSEMVQLVYSLSEETKTPVPKLLYLFGRYLFDTFVTNYPDFFTASENAYEFLGSIENYIHVQVLKLYPDAELPKFITDYHDESIFKMIYISERKMADFALGLIEKSLEHYGENADIDMQKLTEDGKEVLFIITKKNESE